MSILFGLGGVKVRVVERHAQRGPEGKVVRSAQGGGARVVHVLTDDPSEGACPAWGVLSTSVRQRRTTRPRDLPYGEQALLVRWHKTQWTCRGRACPRKAFIDQTAELPAGGRVTGRLRRYVTGRVADGLAVSVAGDGLLSWPIAHAAWAHHAREMLAIAGHRFDRPQAHPCTVRPTAQPGPRLVPWPFRSSDSLCDDGRAFRPMLSRTNRREASASNASGELRSVSGAFGSGRAAIARQPTARRLAASPAA